MKVTQAKPSLSIGFPVYQLLDESGERLGKDVSRIFLGTLCLEDGEEDQFSMIKPRLEINEFCKMNFGNGSNLGELQVCLALITEPKV